jgi:flagellar biogenesis protein FliO
MVQLLFVARMWLTHFESVVVVEVAPSLVYVVGVWFEHVPSLSAPPLAVLF